MSGSVWTFGGQGAMELIRLASNLIVTRLLVPEAFGLMALVNVFLAGLAMFSDVGIGPSIVQHKRGNDPTFQNTAWTLQAARGAFLALMCVLLGSVYADFYSQPALAHMLPAVGLAALFEGLHSTVLFTMRRNLRFQRYWMLKLGSQVAGIVTMIVWAWMAPSVWALVAGRVVSSGGLCLLSHVAGGGIRHRFRWERDAARDLVTFGKWIFLSTALAFCAAQVDRITLGKLVPIATLGIYNIALMLAQLQTALVQRLSHSVLFPAIAASARKNPAGLPDKLTEARATLLPLAVCGVSGLVAAGPLFFALLYDERYQEAGWMSRGLALWVWPTLLRISMDRALIVVGEVKALATSNLAGMLIGLVGVVAGYHFAGFPGAIGGAACGATASYLTVLVSLHVRGISTWRQDLWFTGWAACGMSGAYLATEGLRAAVPSLGTGAGLPVAAIAGAFAARTVLKVWSQRKARTS